jgi:hypothetical protein
MKLYKYKFNPFNKHIKHITIISQNDREALLKINNLQTSLLMHKNQLLLEQNKI